MSIEGLLVIIAILLVGILWKLSAINRRLKERFPTEKEDDLKWAKADPMGHFEAHKHEYESKKRG
jgi:hypothetical protein